MLQVSIKGVKNLLRNPKTKRNILKKPRQTGEQGKGGEGEQSKKHRPKENPLTNGQLERMGQLSKAKDRKATI